MIIFCGKKMNICLLFFLLGESNTARFRVKKKHRLFLIKKCINKYGCILDK